MDNETSQLSTFTQICKRLSFVFSLNSSFCFAGPIFACDFRSKRFPGISLIRTLILFVQWDFFASSSKQVCLHVYCVCLEVEYDTVLINASRNIQKTTYACFVTKASRVALCNSASQ